MTNVWTLLAVIAVPIGWVFLMVMVLVTLDRYRKRKLLRCPETGGVSLVDIEWDIAAKSVRNVKDCLLWPKRLGCGNGCLDHSA